MLVLSPVAVLATPDIMSRLIILAALFAAEEQRNSALALLLGIMAVSIRTDNVVFVAAIAGMLVWRRQVTLLRAALATGTALAIVLMINHLTGNYGWLVLLQHTFAGFMIHPAHAVVHFSPMRHATLIAHNAVELIFENKVTILLAACASAIGGRLKPLFWIVAAVTVAKFLLFPSVETRHLAALIVASSLALSSAHR